ncbi:DNA-binding protein, partial [Mesorhizobium sp. M7A.F.Ca.AU.001.01.1.1]
MATLVDTNVLVDIAVRDPGWSKWSWYKMVSALEQGSLGMR